MRTLFTILLLIHATVGLEVITNTIPDISKVISTTQLEEQEIFRGQHFSYKFPSNTGYYANRVSNDDELKQKNVTCKWQDQLYNYSNIANTKDLNLSEEEKVIAAGSVNGSMYYLLTSANRLLQIKSEMSTKSLKLIRSDKVQQNVQPHAEMWRYNGNLVFKANDTLVFAKDTGLSYVPLAVNDTVIKITPAKDFIYLLSQKSLRRWKGGMVQDIDLGKDVENLVDIDVDSEGKVYILDSRRGIYIVNGSSYKQYSFNSSEGYFTKLKVINKTIECVYTLQKANFLVELYLLGDKLSINKIYPINAHINDIVVFNHYVVLIHDYHLTLLQHSANRQIPELAYSDIISSILLVGVTRIAKLDGEMMLLLKDKGAFLSKQIEVRPPQLVCEFVNTGTYKINIEYELPSCQIAETQKSNDPIHQYCLRQISKTITIKEGRRRGTVIFAYILFGMITLAGLVMIVYGIVHCGREIRKKQELVRTMQEKRSKRPVSTGINLNDTSNVNATGITGMQPL